MSEKKIVICDIDGTIANNVHRQHFLEGKKDWDGFFSELYKDKPIFEIIDKVNSLENEGHKIYFLTGRPEKYKLQTKDWLKKYFTFDLELLMRNNSDRRNKIEIKKELFQTYLSSFEIKVIFENDPNLICLWKKLGLNVFEVNN